MIDRILDALASLPIVPTYVVLMVLSALENVFPRFPPTPRSPSGPSSPAGEVSVVPLAALCWLANFLSAAGTYAFARTHGPAFFREGWGRKLLSPGVMAALEEAYGRWGVAGIFLSRFLPGVRAAVTPFAGIAGLSPMRALVPAAAASAIWYALLAAAGYAVAHNWEAVKALVADTNRVLGLLAVAATALAALWVWRRSRRSEP